MELQESNMEVDKKSIEVPLLNPMAFYPGFPHIVKKIFQKMDKDSLKSLRLLSKSWMAYIDDQNLLWNEIIENKDSNKVFQLACINGHSKLAEFLLQNSRSAKDKGFLDF